MATKSDQYKADSQRAAQTKKKPAAASGAGRPVRKGKPRAAAVPNPAGHNLSTGAAKKKNSTYAFEVSETTRPSRKSTRRSPNHIKTDAPLRITAMNKNNSPRARASRSA